MPKVIFGLAALQAGEVAAIAVHAYQPDAQGAWQQVAEALLAELPANPDNQEEYLWDTEEIDSGTSLLLVPVSAAGEHRMSGGSPIPPLAAADSCIVTVLVQSQSGAPVAGVELVSTLQSVPAKVGAAIIDPARHTAVTDAEGIAVFVYKRGLKTVISSRLFNSLRLAVDTTGQAHINLAAQLAG